MSIFVNSRVTESLYSDKEQLKTYGEKLSELKTIAEEKEPNGLLITALIGEKEKYTPINKLINDLASINRYYSVKVLQSNPELIQEYAEVLNHIKAINTLFSKRKKTLSKRKKRIDNNEQNEQELIKNTAHVEEGEQSD